MYIKMELKMHRRISPLVDSRLEQKIPYRIDPEMYSRKRSAEKTRQKMAFTTKPNEDAIGTNENINSIFPLLFLIGLIMGLPLTPSFATSNEQGFGTFAYLWICLSTIVKCIVFVIGFPYAYYMIPGISPKLTHYAFNICGVFTILFMIIKRKKLYHTVQDLHRFSIAIRPGQRIGAKWKWFQIIALTLLIIFFLVSQFLYMFQHDLEPFLRQMPVPYFIPENQKILFLRFAVACPEASFCVSVAAFSFMVLIGFNIYIASIDLIKAYGSYLRVCGQHVSGEEVFSLIENFTRLCAIMIDIDETLHWYMFFVYCAIFGGVFNTVSFMVSDTSELSTETLLYIICVFLAASGIMIVLSYCGTTITSECSMLKQLVKEYSLEFLQSSPTVSLQQAFNILIDMIINTTFVITGGNMFTINNGLILTIIGVMVTYGVLMFQMEHA